MEKNYKWTQADEDRFKQKMAELRSQLVGQDHAKFSAWLRETGRDPLDPETLVAYRDDVFWQTDGRRSA